MATINPEVRAAETVAAISTDYARGGWFAMMTRGEQDGWNIAEAEYWSGEIARAPRNNREQAGWLAFWMLHDDFNDEPDE